MPSILLNDNKETWLAVDGNILNIFTTKISAIQHRLDNSEKSIKVLHRYSDGTMEPLLFWSDEKVEIDRPLMDLIDEEHGFYDDFDDDLDFYDLVASNDSLPIED